MARDDELVASGPTGWSTSRPGWSGRARSCWSGERVEAAARPRPAGARGGGRRPARAHAAAGPDRLPHTWWARSRVRDPGDRPQRRPGGAQRRRQRPRHRAGRVHDRPRRRHLPGVRRRGPARRHQGRHRGRAADGGGRRVRHRPGRRRRRHRPGPRHRAAPRPPLRRGHLPGRGPPAGAGDPVRRRRLHQGDRHRGRARPRDPAGAPELSEEELAAAVTEAAAHGAHVAAHAHGTQGILNAARAGARSIEHGSLLDDEAADLLAERDLPGGRHLQRRLHRLRGASRAGRPRRWPRTRPPPRPSATASPRRSRPGCGSPTAPTAASTRTAGTPGSCPTWSATG